ncbi:hypothetical protein [Levilactobacillus spicheri]|uniref:Uncharacterized protein n=2 Tax=Levilactobacillus spicheri TaxID=216463 RepID=A0ABQ0WUE5_9LACO|nr:hypothetical protein [Levilactobacillus spicheri]KRL47420.1 hypothetical protein FD37_GL002286 [Levilactobacillus spicheri DSM 15429]GEO67839.1 hypothetical protein LSP04_22580 [Levilactobacillus spicheri]
MLTNGLPLIFFVLLLVVAIATAGSTAGTNHAAPGVRAMRTIYVVVVSAFVVGVLFCYVLGNMGPTV